MWWSCWKGENCCGLLDGSGEQGSEGLVEEEQNGEDEGGDRCREMREDEMQEVVEKVEDGLCLLGHYPVLQLVSWLLNEIGIKGG